MIFKGLCLPESYPADLRPVIEPLEHGDSGHSPQKKNKPPRPISDRAIAIVLMKRLKSSNVFVGGRLVHGNTNSASPSGAKGRSSAASPPSPRSAARHAGSLSLSTITARTPS